MVVQTFELTPGVAGRMGLDVGASNVREHFSRGVLSVELELDHLRIVCALEPEFWEGRPEIHDARLSLWLEAKRMGGKLVGAAAPMAMIPVDGGAFRLEAVIKAKVPMERDRADYALTSTHESLPETSPMTPAADLATPPPIVAPIVAFDRRKRSVAHHPERRRLGMGRQGD